MSRYLIVAVAVAMLSIAPIHAQEAPPYSPPISEKLVTSYVNADLNFSIRYPVEFTPSTVQDLHTVMERGHLLAYGTDPKGDPEHLQAEKCMRPLLYATTGAADWGKSKVEKVEGKDQTPDTILVMDVDRTCVPKKVKGDKALTQLAGTLLDLPGMKPLVPQMWFEGGGGRRIHSGMAGGTISVPGSATVPTHQVQDYIIAAAFEQKGHWIVVAYINGTRDDGMHTSFPYTAVSFEDGKPVLLFPFLFGKVNVVK
ncbi:MAG: hypothetical protein ABI147_12585 [Acidobacteriaceae bacterium]